MKRWMQKLKELPRWKRDIIGSTACFGSLFVMLLLGVMEEYALVLTIPFMMFFAWLCPETWSGK